MAKYRQVHTHIWKDNWFIELEPIHKLFFIYLFSNERASISGIYELSKRVMSFESGLDYSEIDKAFKIFEKAKKAFFEDGIVFVVNLRRYHETSSPTVQKAIAEDLAKIDNCRLKGIYNEIYGIDTLSGDENTPPIPRSSSSLPNSSSSSISSENGSEPKLPPVPVHLAVPEFMNEWGEWVQYHEDRGSPLPFKTALLQFKTFEEWGIEQSVESMKKSRHNNWVAPAEPMNKKSGKETPAERIARLEKEMANEGLD